MQFKGNSFNLYFVRKNSVTTSLNILNQGYAGPLSTCPVCPSSKVPSE